MKYSSFKFLLFSIVFSWIITGCGSEVTTTVKEDTEFVSAKVSLDSNQTNIRENKSVKSNGSDHDTSNCVSNGVGSVKKPKCTSETPPVLPTLTFSASSSSVNMNASTTLSWSTTDATECTASGDWSGSKAASGSEVIYSIVNDNTFNLSCSGPGGVVNDSVSVTVIADTTPTLNLTASPLSVEYNGDTILTWSSTNVSSCSAAGDWSGSKATSGSETFNALTANQVFTLYCIGNGGSASESVSVTVQPAPAPTMSLSASSTNVSQGDSTTLNWSSTNATSCTASGDWSGTKATSGSETFNALTEDQVFTLSCSGNGGSAYESVSVTVQPAPAPTMSLSASSTNVSQGDSTTLNWSSTNATSCTASGDWSGTKATSGSETFNALTEDQVFTLSCSGNGGSVYESVSVTVQPAPAPTVSLSASSTNVSQGGAITLSWNSTDAISCSASGDWIGTKESSGSETINELTADSQFVLECSGAGGSSSDSVNVTVVLNNTGTALLSWTPPTENTDGSMLADLAGYRVYYGTQPGNYTESVEIANPGLASYLIENLAPANWYFVMTAYNTSNIESAYSPEVSKVIN